MPILKAVIIILLPAAFLIKVMILIYVKSLSFEGKVMMKEYCWNSMSLLMVIISNIISFIYLRGFFVF